MSLPHKNIPNRYDFYIALVIAVLGLVIYTRVLAPDILYGDSGEFQTLAYTWGTTHTTGYPVYLALARVVGLIPVNTLAWRINFASAVAAAITLGGVYLVARHYTQRAGAVLASLLLLVSYTFWSQSIIAEVYTPATALIVMIFLTVLWWHEHPAKRRWCLILAGFLLGAGLGVHLFLLLIAPSVFLFVLWGIVRGTVEERRQWGHMFRLMLGGTAGVALFYGLFALMDVRPTPTNLFTTAIVPSSEIWGLQASDLDTVPERFWISVSGYQWRDRMLPTDVDYQEALEDFFNDHLTREFSTPALLLALLGMVVALISRQRRVALIAVAGVTAFAAGFLYFPGDKYIFYLPFYVVFAVFAAIGAGALVGLIAGFLPTFLPRPVSVISLTLILAGVCVSPMIGSRWQAIQRGQSLFIKEDYVYPVLRPNEPRYAAECAVSKVTEPEALLVLDWRALYAIYYVAHVEQDRTGLVIREALPYPASALAESLRADIAKRLAAGEAVYVDDGYTPLRATYTLTSVRGDCPAYRLFRLSLKD